MTMRAQLVIERRMEPNLGIHGNILEPARRIADRQRKRDAIADLQLS